ncbi:hypothetical protein FSARC_8676 [Fusarium sarcochroum]|uniref:Uncharacterized protein n=1 Tax=Fusarium sarcochroum TaxID=1208366 RepID=A0A8H4TSS7_9HYPO|nr:hypothetical protein FSARC_8676 [Fusarium sarcochroum]
MSVPANLVPDGWTTDAQEMMTEYYWGQNGMGRLVAVSVGITNPEALMVKSKESGGDGYVFRASNRIYLWSMPMDDVYEYTNPAGLKAILAEMCKPAGRGKVETKFLPRNSQIDM